MGERGRAGAGSPRPAGEQWASTQIRVALNGIIHQMAAVVSGTICPGNSATIPRCIAPFNATDKGVLTEIWAVLVGHCQVWAMWTGSGKVGKACKRGDLVGPNPTDRAKNGTKRSLIVDAKGGILSVTLSTANRHDAKMLAATVADMIRAGPNQRRGRRICVWTKVTTTPAVKRGALEAG